MNLNEIFKQFKIDLGMLQNIGSTLIKDKYKNEIECFNLKSAL